jgi:hypothetical protein
MKDHINKTKKSEGIIIRCALYALVPFFSRVIVTEYTHQRQSYLFFYLTLAITQSLMVSVCVHITSVNDWFANRATKNSKCSHIEQIVFFSPRVIDVFCHCFILRHSPFFHRSCLVCFFWRYTKEDKDTHAFLFFCLWKWLDSLGETRDQEPDTYDRSHACKSTTQAVTAANSN